MKNVGLFEKVIALPMGIETVLSKEFLSNGQLMSSGECQRIALARIFVKPSAVSILDEPTSSLDSISQSSIMDKIYAYSKTNTLIIISHRLTDVKQADKIIVLKDGKIIESGTHEELLIKKKEYYRLCKKQEIATKQPVQ